MARINGTEGADDRHGTDSADVMLMNGGNDKAAGWAGNDEIHGGAGNDTLNGGDGADTLMGEGGYDKLYGGAGRDVLVDGAGTDYLWGGDGADRFTFRSASTDNDQEAPVISDFSHLDDDRIDVSDIDANWNVAGNQAFRFVGETDQSTGPGEISYYKMQYGDGSWVTWIDLNTDRDPEPEMVIAMQGYHTMIASDFIL